MEWTSRPLLFFRRVSSPVWEERGGMVLNRMYGERESMGKLANPGLHGSMDVIHRLEFIAFFWQPEENNTIK